MGEPTHHHDESGDVRRERLARAFHQGSRGRPGTATPILAGLGLAVLIALVVGLVGAIRAPERDPLAARTLSGAAPQRPTTPAAPPARAPSGERRAAPSGGASSERSSPSTSAEAVEAPLAPYDETLPYEPLPYEPPLPEEESATASVEDSAALASEPAGEPVVVAALGVCPPGTAPAASSSQGDFDGWVAALAGPGEPQPLALGLPSPSGDPSSPDGDGDSDGDSDADSDSDATGDEAEDSALECVESPAVAQAPAEPDSPARPARTSEPSNARARAARRPAARSARIRRAQRVHASKRRAAARRRAARAEARRARAQRAARRPRRAEPRRAPRAPRRAPRTPRRSEGGTPITPSGESLEGAL